MAPRLSQQNPSPLSGPAIARVFLVGCLIVVGAFIGSTTNVARANSNLAWDSGITGISNRLANVTGVYSSPTGLPTPALTTTGGTAPVLFSIDPALGAGLSFDTSTGVVSGTPSGAYGPIDHVITATDADGDLIETSVYIHLTTQVELSPSSQRLTMVKDMGFFADIQPIREFAWSGTTLTVTARDHGLNVGDVVGLDFRDFYTNWPSPTGDEPFSGVYEVVSVPTTTSFTVSGQQGGGSASRPALNSDGSEDGTYGFMSSCNYSGCADPILWSGEAASYTISPALPAGLSLNPNTGVIFTEYGDAPVAAQTVTQYTITADNGSATRDTTVFIEILEIDTVVATVDAFFWHPRPLANGQSCTSSPALPAGLSFDGYCGVSGMPTEVAAAQTYTITPGSTWGGDPVVPTTVSIEVTAGVQSDYELFINQDPSTGTATPMVGTGWQRFSGVSQFQPAGITKVGSKAAVTITGLAGSSVRAAMDISRPGTWSDPDGPGGFDPMQGMSDYCPGLNVAERDALTTLQTGTAMYESVNRADIGFGVENEWCARGGYAKYLLVEDENEVTFVLDIAGANPATYSAMLQIEVDAEGDGFRTGSGDQIFEINLQSDPLQKCSLDEDSGDFSCAASVTDDLSVFLADTNLDLVYLDPVPACASSGGQKPCVTEITPGWAVRLMDNYAAYADFGFAEHSLQLIPYPTAFPFTVEVGDTVDMTVELPSGTARGRDWGDSLTTGASIADSGAKFNSYSLSQDATGATVDANMTARSGTWVFSTGSGAGQQNFNDLCNGSLAVSGGVPFIDANDNDTIDPGEEDVSGCQNTPDTAYITSILLAPGVGTVQTSAAHGFSAGDQVTMCCVGPPFDGTHTVASTPSASSFTISTVGLTDEFSGQDLSTADWHGTPFLIDGFVAPGDILNVPNTQVDLSITLMAPFPGEEVLAGAYVTTNAQATAFGESIMAGEAFDFAVGGPSYDEDGNPRTNGFFQICVPAAAIQEWFGLTLTEGLAAMQLTRDGSLVGSGLTQQAGQCGSTPGMEIELDPFSFSAPYFKAAPNQVTAGSSSGSGSSGGGSSSPIVAAASFTGIDPARLLDTRGSSKVGELDGTGVVRELAVAGVAGVPSSGVAAVALNVTVVDGEASGGGYVTVFPCGVRPNASNVNFVSGDTVANSVIAPVSSDGKVCFYVFGKAHLLADISGYIRS